MSFPTVYYITQVIPPCYSAGYAMCVCVSSEHVYIGVLVYYLALSCTRMCHMAYNSPGEIRKHPNQIAKEINHIPNERSRAAL